MTAQRTIKRRGQSDLVIMAGTIVAVNWNADFCATPGPRWVEAEIQDILSSQFTALLSNGTNILTYRFFTDYGDSWSGPEVLE